MRKFITAGIAVKNSLSSDNGNANCAEKLGNVFRNRAGRILGVVENGDFDKLVRFQSVGKGFQKIVGNPPFADLGDGAKVCRQGAKLASLFAGNVFVGYYHDNIVFLFFIEICVKCELSTVLTCIATFGCIMAVIIIFRNAVYRANVSL